MRPKRRLADLISASVVAATAAAFVATLLVLGADLLADCVDETPIGVTFAPPTRGEPETAGISSTVLDVITL